MTKSINTYLTLIAVLLAPVVANADPITLAEFDGSATTVDFSDAVDGQATYIGSGVTVSGGVSQTNLFDPVGPMDIFNYTNNAENGTPRGQALRIDFGSLVSAVGMDVHYNSSPVLLELYSLSDILLGSLLSSPSDYTDITGFIGFDVGAISIAYAMVSVPGRLGSHNLYIDNVIYQSVPEPGTLALLGLGLLGMGAVRRRKV